MLGALGHITKKGIENEETSKKVRKNQGVVRQSKNRHDRRQQSKKRNHKKRKTKKRRVWVECIPQPIHCAGDCVTKNDLCSREVSLKRKDP